MKLRLSTSHTIEHLRYLLITIVMLMCMFKCIGGPKINVIIFIELTNKAFALHSGFSSPRINLSPFTKDFRGEEHYNESID